MQPYFYPIYPVPYWRNRYVPMVKYAEGPSWPASTGGAPRSAKGGPRRAVSLGEALEAIITDPDARVFWMAQGRPLTREGVQQVLDWTGLPYTRGVPNPVASPASTGGAPRSAKGGPRRAVSLGEALEAIITDPDARVFWMAQGRPLTREGVQQVLDWTDLPYTLR